MIFLPSIVASVVYDPESPAEPALPGPIERFLRPVSCHFSENRGTTYSVILAPFKVYGALETDELVEIRRATDVMARLGPTPQKKFWSRALF